MKKTDSVQNLDIDDKGPTLSPMKTSTSMEVVDEWRGRGWGFKLKRKRTSVTTTTEGCNDDERS